MARQEVGKPKDVQRQEAAAKYDNVRKLLTRPDIKAGMGEIMGRYASKDRLFNVVLNYVRQNEGLLDCTQSSLIAGIVGIFKLQLDPTLKQVHLIPFWNTKKKQMEATLIIDYRGKIALMKRNGEVQSVSAHAVYEKDELKMRFGTEEYIEHIPPADGDRGEKVKGAYIVVTYKDGSKSQDYMSAAEIEKRMAMSKTVDRDKDGNPVARSGVPWGEWYEEMAIKTVIHHHSKQVPMSVEERVADEIDGSQGALTQIDMLPGSVENLLTGEAQGEEISPVAIFDEKASKLMKPEQEPLWSVYLQETANLHKISVDELKATYKDDADKVVASFEKYKEAKGGKKEPETAPEDRKAQTQTVK